MSASLTLHVDFRVETEEGSGPPHAQPRSEGLKQVYLRYTFLTLPDVLLTNSILNIVSPRIPRRDHFPSIQLGLCFGGHSQNATD